MPESRDQGAVPQGLIEQARAKDVDPGRLQELGKQAASLYSSKGANLSDAVVEVIGSEDLGPEHTRRVCEFANQAAFQNEWEKGGSVRNVEFDGGPADPAVVLRELNDGARPVEEPGVRRISDYDTPPEKIARADSRVEEKIFGKYAMPMTVPSEIPSGTPDLARLRTTITGAQDHIHSKVSGLEVTKEAVARELGDAVSEAVLGGDSLFKIASCWTHFCNDKRLFQEALEVSIDRMRERQVPDTELEVEKLASEQEAIGRIPNAGHPVVSRFMEFIKVAQQLNILRGAGDVLSERLEDVHGAMREVNMNRPPSMPHMGMALLTGMMKR